MITGIDVSRWQGIIDWPRVKQHVKFAVIKIGGSDVGFYPDGQAVRNVLEARSAGIEALGFYVYLGGVFSPADEVAHIKNLINNIGGLRPGEFFVLDWEENHADEVGYVHAIAKGLVDAGLPAPMIYMNLSYVKRKDWRRLVDLGCGLWVAAWGDNDAVPEAHEVPGSDEWPFWAIWQYSSTGSVPGIAGRVDMNQFNGTPDQLKKYGTTRNVSMPVTVKTSQAIGTGTNGEYVVVSGDNLSAIAAKYGKSWQELWSLNRDRVSNPNKIFPGLKLRVWANDQPAAPAPKPADTGRYHTVVAGDNLSAIAAKYGLPSYVLLWEANKDQIPDPNMIPRPEVEDSIMARWDREDVIPIVIMVVLAAAAAIAIFFWLNSSTGVSAATEKPFDHSNCQYPERWSNPPDGCDNSDPAVPECIKGITSEAAEKACIDRFVASYEQKDGSTPISEISTPPAASHEVKSPTQPVNCTEITK